MNTSCCSLNCISWLIFITLLHSFTQELRRTWEMRSRIPWGMPSPEFDIKNSLLLLDSDQDISDDTEIVEEGTDVSISDIYSTDGSEIFATDGANPIDMSSQKASLLATDSGTENDYSNSIDNDKPKKYVMRPPMRITAYELHQKISDGFVFDREVRNTVFFIFLLHVFLFDFLLPIRVGYARSLYPLIYPNYYHITYFIPFCYYFFPTERSLDAVQR